VRRIRSRYVEASIFRFVDPREGVQFRTIVRNRYLSSASDFSGLTHPDELEDVIKVAAAAHSWLLEYTDCLPIPAEAADAREIPVPPSRGGYEIEERYCVQVGGVQASIWYDQCADESCDAYYWFVTFRRVGHVDLAQWAGWEFRPEDVLHIGEAASRCHAWWTRRFDETE